MCVWGGGGEEVCGHCHSVMHECAAHVLEVGDLGDLLLRVDLRLKNRRI